MRKAPISGFGTSSGLSSPGSWLDIERTATAEMSSEDPQHPFERALRTETADGWKASDPGPQVIRLRFDSPQSIRRIYLQFREEEVNRSQEIALFATSKTSPRKELVRQQWVFSPQGAPTEVEDYFFNLNDVTALELEIDPGSTTSRFSLHSSPSRLDKQVPNIRQMEQLLLRFACRPRYEK